MFGLPTITALFVFGGFVTAVVLSVVYAVTLRTDGDEWRTADGLSLRDRKRG